ncbi:hypothetical protein PMIN03_004001 [Paraphaeosphaeria minitans]
MGWGWYCKNAFKSQYGFHRPNCLRGGDPVERRADVSSASFTFLIEAFGGVAVPSMVLLELDQASSTVSFRFVLLQASLLLLRSTTFSPQCRAVKTNNTASNTRLYVLTSFSAKDCFGQLPKLRSSIRVVWEIGVTRVTSACGTDSEGGLA